MASTPTPWPGCRWSTPPGCGPPIAGRGPGGAGPPRAGCDGSPARPPTTSGASTAWSASCCRPAPVGELGQADLAVLERWADPQALVAVGRARLQRLLASASAGQQGTQRAEQWLAAAHAALELYGDHSAIAFQALAAEVHSEVRLLRATQAELVAHAMGAGSLLPAGRPGRAGPSLPGLAEIGGPALVATMGKASRFCHRASSAPSPAWLPRASETGQTDRKGQLHQQAGNRLLRTTLVRAADHARRQDPQLARIYWTQMVERGKDHLGRSVWSPPTWPSAPGRS